MKNKRKRSKKQYEYEKKWLHAGPYCSVCSICGEKQIYFEKYDALCCPNCNIWTEGVCSDPNCFYCNNRPETPKEGLIILNLERNEEKKQKEYFIKKYERRIKAKNYLKKREKVISINENK